MLAATMRGLPKRTPSLDYATCHASPRASWRLGEPGTSAALAPNMICANITEMVSRSPRTPSDRQPRSRSIPAQGADRRRKAPTAPETDIPPLAGNVLIAMPSMGDERFERSVIFLCLHNAQGAMGIILNRPLEQPSFADLLKQLEVAPNPPARSIGLTSGGPMDNARGFVLHTGDWTGENSMRVEPGLALTASLDVLKALAEGGGPRQGVLALGYAGWGPGQLDQELQTNTWLLAPSDPALLFDDDHATKWRRALAKLKVDPTGLSNIVGHA